MCVGAKNVVLSNKYVLHSAHLFIRDRCFQLLDTDPHEKLEVPQDYTVLLSMELNTPTKKNK